MPRRTAAAPVAVQRRFAPGSLFDETDPASWRAAAAVGIAGAAALAVLGLLVRHEPTPRGDDEIYQRMALHPFAVHTFPFGYRLGLPLLVHLLPIGTTAAFVGLAWLAAAGAAAYAYKLMVELGGQPRAAAALAVLMCISPPFLLVVIRQGRNTDIATVMFLMAATYFIVRRAYWKLAVTLLVGVVFREAVLFAVPLAYAVWARRPFDGSAAARSLSTGVAAVAAYAGLRIGLSTVGEAQVPGYGGSLLGARVTVLEEGLRTPFRELRRLFTIYGPLWLVSPLALRDMRFARRGLVLVALSLVAMTFALDWGRMILLASPVFYAAGAWVVTRQRRLLAPTLLAFLALAVGYAIYMQVSGVQHGIIDNGPPPYPVR